MEGLAGRDIRALLEMVANMGTGPPLLPDEQINATVDAWPVFSETHKRLLCANRLAVDPEKGFVTGLGVDLVDYWTDEIDGLLHNYVTGRLLYANDPQRGLWHVLDIFDKLRPLMPDATLHVAYE